jgi:hypothetical protein
MIMGKIRFNGDLTTQDIYRLRKRFGFNNVHVNRDAKRGQPKPAGKMKW